MIFLIALMFTVPAEAGWFRDFCERNIVSTHPFQAELERLPTVKVVDVYRKIAAKVYWAGETNDEHQMALAVLVMRYRSNPTPAEREMIEQAFDDYPTWQTQSMSLGVKHETR